MNDRKEVDPASLPWLGRKLLWVDDKAKVTRLFYGLIVVAILLFAIDLVYPRYGAFDFELTWGFFAFYGFVSFTFIIFSVKLLRKLLMREETYYSPYVIDGEEYPDAELDIKSIGDD